jgi:prepilin-type N-terminal cleavage/methylation domain-containing protein
MLARLRKAQDENEGGFTLIELLVVIIIIGILAAIAIPVFLNQRKKAVDTSMKSDLRTVANEEETYFTDNQKYIAAPAAAVVAVGATNVTLSKGNVGSVILNATGSAYCILVTRAAGFQPSSQDWTYVSNLGGLQAAPLAACPAPAAF